MANSSLLQVRTDPKDREEAADICASLGTNLSAVVNMLLKQIILTKSIPFEIKLNHPAYTNEQAVAEVKSSLAMEGMPLNNEEVQMLKDYADGLITGEELRMQILSSVSKQTGKQDREVV